MIEKYYLESDINEIVQNLRKYKKIFSGKSFLISGANGFLGKYEKFLRTAVDRKTNPKEINIPGA